MNNFYRITDATLLHCPDIIFKHVNFTDALIEDVFQSCISVGTKDFVFSEYIDIQTDIKPELRNIFCLFGNKYVQKYERLLLKYINNCKTWSLLDKKYSVPIQMNTSDCINEYLYIRDLNGEIMILKKNYWLSDYQMSINYKITTYKVDMNKLRDKFIEYDLVYYL